MELEYINKILHVNQYNICSIYERRSMEIQYKVVKDTNTLRGDGESMELNDLAKR